MIELARKLLREHYGIDGVLKELVAYASHNFLVTEASTQYILKLYTNSEDFELVEAENSLLLHLDGKELLFNVPKPIPNQQGQLLIETNHDGQPLLIRLLSYLPGDFLGDIGYPTEKMKHLGGCFGQLDHNLIDFDHVAYRARTYEWDLQNIHLALAHAPLITDLGKRKLVEYFGMQFQENVIPQYSNLRKGAIHNDGHELNILHQGKDSFALIDFGDVVMAPLIQELAVLVTYAIMDQEEPLPIAMALAEGYHSQNKLESEEVALLYYLIAGRLCISLCMSAYSIRQDPDNQYLLISEASAWSLLEKLLTINPAYFTNEIRRGLGFSIEGQTVLAEQINQRNDLLSKSLSVSYRSPIHMERAAFQYMYDSEGRTFLDGVNNIFHVGHAHPRVIEAGQRQMAKLNTNTRYLYDELNQYAESLLNHFDDQLNRVFFVNSGSAATDLALRLARQYVHSDQTLIMDHGYHGNTSAGIEVSAYKFNGKGGPGKARNIHIAPLPDHSTDMNAAINVVEGLLNDQPEIKTFISESIVGCGGQVPLAPQYARSIENAIHRRGGVYIADEVQTGFGRVGSHFWAYQSLGIGPDIVILGKPIGNGHPLAAVVTTKEITEAFENGMEFFSSFGGNPVSCAVGQAVLDVMEEEALQKHAHETGQWLIENLQALQKDFSVVREIRGSGLFLGIDLAVDGLPATEYAAHLVNQLKENGILLSTDGPDNNVIKFKPPLCFNQSNGQQMIEQLHQFFKTNSPK